MMRPHWKHLAFFFLVVAEAPAFAQVAKHVVIISMDGAKPSLIKKNKMPTLTKMIEEGAAALGARTSYPSKTLPAHSSMLSGVGPERHGITWNDWDPKRGVIGVPTVFSIARAQGRRTAIVATKEKFKHLRIEGSLDEFVVIDAKAPKVAEAAGQVIKSQRPDLLFVHFREADAVGHRFMWDSPMQKNAMKDVDRGISIVKEALASNGMIDNTLVLVTADHGGKYFFHGGKSDDHMVIPWIAWGAGVNKGKVIHSSVVTMDTAATALWALSVPIPLEWQGRAVQEAFVQEN